MTTKPSTVSASIRAIELARSVFEHIHGNLGILKFSVEELKPTNGSPTTESQKWDVVCSFFESLGSSSPTRFLASVNLIENTVTIKKLSAEGVPPQKYTVSKQEDSTENNK